MRFLRTIVFVFIFSKELAQWFLKDAELNGVFHWFAIGLVFLVLNSLLLAILNTFSTVQNELILYLSFIYQSSNLFGVN